MNDDCTICLEHLACEPISELNCGHEFHRSCVEQWSKYSQDSDRVWGCPNCRFLHIIPPKPPPTPVKKKEVRVVRIASVQFNKDWILIFEERLLPLWPPIGV